MTESTDVPRSPPGGGWKLADDRNEGIGWSSSWHIKVLHAWYDCKPLSTLLPLEPFPQIKLPPLETVKSERYLVMLVLLNWTRRPSLVINCLFSLRQIGSWGSFSLEVIGHSFYLRFSHISLPPRILLFVFFKHVSRQGQGKKLFTVIILCENISSRCLHEVTWSGAASRDLGFFPSHLFPHREIQYSNIVPLFTRIAATVGGFGLWRRRRIT